MSWEQLEIELNNLSRKIDFIPEMIIGIVRGGIIPARLIATQLEIKNMYGLTVKKIGNERKVTSEILEDISDKKILLMEDMLETGKSLAAAKQYLEKKGAIVKTACLYIMPASEITPDYYLKKIDEAVSFPWE